MRAPGFWNQPERGIAAQLLRPLGAIYGAATAWRMAWPGARLEVPVICVGNFVAGGAGKTPLALELARMLQARGETVFFLSRGYGGERRRAPLLVEAARHGAREVGDEPLLLAALAPTVVGADRLESARLAISLGAGVLVMDDGLQNPALAKTLALAVVDGATGIGNGLCVPAGPLRAPLAAQSRYVQAVVLVGPGAAGNAAAAAANGLPVLRASLVPDPSMAAQLCGARIVAFAGIGRPEKFFATLEGLGANILARRSFADHHPFDAAELAVLAREATQQGALLVTTLKDLVRMPEGLRPPGLLALPVRLAFADEGAAALALMAGAIKIFRTGSDRSNNCA